MYLSPPPPCQKSSHTAITMSKNSVMSHPSHYNLIVGDFDLPQISQINGYDAMGNNDDQNDPLFECLSTVFIISGY